LIGLRVSISLRIFPLRDLWVIFSAKAGGFYGAIYKVTTLLSLGDRVVIQLKIQPDTPNFDYHKVRAK
jgi:hypothetical protein